jgi:hypothetical protein
MTTSNKEHSFNEILQAGLAAAVVLAACPVGAESVMDEPRQVFDLATVTCKQFLALPTAGMASGSSIGSTGTIAITRSRP